MRIDKEFRKKVRSECYDALQAAGFTRYRYDGVDWPLHNGFHAWVGLNEGWNNDCFEINPFVGIHVVQIERLWHSMVGTKYHRGRTTYALHVGELPSASNERAFAFTPQQSDSFIESEAQRLANLYARSGLDYARSIASYDLLLPLLEGRIEMLGGYPERVACCLYLKGEHDRARTFVREFLAREPDYFRSFADPFLSMMDAEEAKR